MKSKKKQRLLALILSMVLMLGASISAMAEGEVQTEPSGTENMENQVSTQSLEEGAGGEIQETEPAPAENEPTPAQTEPSSEDQGNTPVTATGSDEELMQTPPAEGNTETPQETEGGTEPLAEEPTTGDEPQTEESTGTEEDTEETEEIVSESAELRQEFTDENGNVTQTITAYVPEGAFQARADQMSMEVNFLNTDETNYIKGMMEELLPENHYLDGYVFYQIDFKVDGEITQPAKAITISMDGNELEVEDTEKAHVFYYDPADPEVAGDKDELLDIIQKDQLINYLTESGQGTENIEDYDYSEIAVNDGNADTITLKGWESTIYGCYVEKEAVMELNYEDDSVTIKVSADEAGIIPEDAKLQVVPISKENKDTKDQYKEVKEKLQEKAEKEEYEIAGFLAYDICFIDEDGNEAEPNGEVKVSMEYKEAAAPEDVSEKEIKDTQVSMMHLEEDENGEVKDVVDMGQSQKVDTLETTDEKKVQKVEVRTESFSCYTLIWYAGFSERDRVEIHYIDEDGESLDSLVKNTGEGNLKDELKEYGISTSIKLSNEKYAVAIDGYEYQKSTVAGQWTQNKQDATRIYSLRLKESGSIFSKKYDIQYNTDKDEDKDEWKDIDDKNVYMVYRKTSSSEQPGGDTEEGSLGAPDHNKYIKKNKEDKYTLTLDVTGKRGAATAVDILLILDESGSMGDDKDRIKNVNNAITELVSKLNTTEFKENIRLAIVGFGGTAREYLGSDSPYDDAFIRRDWTSLTQFGPYSATYGDKFGTNWQAGISKGETLDWREDANKYVIFMTDGDPTYYYKDDGYTDGEGSEYDTTAFNKAVTEWNNSPRLGAETTTKYVIDITDSIREDSNHCDEFAEAVGATELDGNNAANLTASFQAIANSITRPSYTNVYIQDTLSQYVDFASPLSLTVNKITTDAYGSEKTEPLSENTYRKEINGKTIKITLLNGKALDENVRYEINYDVTVTEDAYTEYIEEGGYNSKGEEGTDHPSVADADRTSSGKDGFRSNANAVVGYTENNKNPQTSLYKHPVVQIDPEEINIPEEPNPIDGSITKTMGKVKDGKYPITLEVKTRLVQTSEAADVDVIFVIDTSSSMKESERIDQTKNAAKTFVENFVGPEGTVNEKHRIGIVTFGTNADAVDYDISKDVQYFSNNSNEIIKAIDDIEVKDNQGTNTYAGLKKAETIIDKDKCTYVILLTDGVPTYHHDADGNADGGGYYSKVEDFNKAVNAAVTLKEEVAGIYTIGFLNGYDTDSTEIDVARRLLASNSKEHYVDGYKDVYRMKSSEYTNGWWGNNEWKVTWDKSQSVHYSDGYFEITKGDDSATELAAIWTQLATIINNKEFGSTGSGWTVTDTMDPYVAFDIFDNLKGTEINGYQFYIENEGTVLKAKKVEGSEDAPIEVASYDIATKTITWTLSDVLAKKSVRYNKGVDYTYTLTYYVDLQDSKQTEFRNTNKTTYVTPKENNRNKIYPDKMPFYINVIGNKLDENTKEALSGAKFSVYLDAACKTLLEENITADENGHFAFQIGQSDMNKAEGAENYTLTVYIKETEAPENYTLDTDVHPLAIQVSSVTYTDKGVAQVEDRNFVVSYAPEKNDMVTWDANKLCIQYGNKKQLIDIPVVKQWVDGTYSNRRQNVTFELYQKAPAGENWGNSGKELTLSAKDVDGNNANRWSGSFTDLDPNYEYQVREKETGNLYVSSGIGNAENGYTITNVLNWNIIKHSSTSGDIPLNGAEFTLSKREDSKDTVVYRGVSGNDGVIQWTEEISKESINSTKLKDDTYILKEIKTPAGYSLNEDEWSIEIKNGFPISITCQSGAPSSKITNEGLEFYFVNDPLYSLPSAGGPGIFLYMIGGTLLLMAGSLMIYINRRRGVLRR